MKFWKTGLPLLILIALVSCADEPAKARKDKADEEISHHAEKRPTEKPLMLTETGDESARTSRLESPEQNEKAKDEGDKDQTEPPGKEELREADRILSFSNQARDVLHGGIYGAADILRDNALYYRENWSLPSRPRLPSRNSGDSRLKAPSGIFTREEEELLAKSLDRMDQALNDILSTYRKLEKYVNDSSIIDDGEKGLKLCAELLQSHGQYTEARKGWMEIVEARAEEAEARLLYNHPLRRQILAARNIFAQMKEIGRLAAQNGNDRVELNRLRQTLSAILAEAGKPPFQASPSLERLYRAFLKEARDYCQILDRGILEGFHNIQRRELNMAAINVREAYNNFVRTANKTME